MSAWYIKGYSLVNNAKGRSPADLIVCNYEITDHHNT